MGPGIIQRLRTWVRRNRLDDELAEEIQLHIELRRQSLIDDGMDPEAARIEARRQFGNVTLKREESRAMWGFPRIEIFVRDLSYAARLLRRAPMFTAVAVMSLGIGIGATTAVFSLVDAVLLRKLPVSDPDELVILKWRSYHRMPAPSLSGFWSADESGQSSTSFSLPSFERLRDAKPANARVIGFAGYWSVNASLDGAPEAVPAQSVSGNFFDVLGMRPAAGRLFSESDDRPEAPAVAVISETLWRTRFGGDSSIVGREISLNGLPVTIIGVMPKGFTSTLQVGDAPGVAVPLSLRPVLERSPQHRTADHWWVLMMARLPSGVAPDAARPPLEAVLRQAIAEGNPQLAQADLPTLELLPGARGQVESRATMHQPLRVMASIVAIVMLAACAIVANLLVARGQARMREISVRIAIGASRQRIVRQLITEGALIATLGSAVGLLFAKWMATVLAPALNSSNDFRLELGTDWRVVGFTAAIASGSTLLFALLPAVRSTRFRLASALQEQPRTVVTSGRRRVVSATLVTLQVALSVLLITAAALLVRSMNNLRAAPLGFDPANVLTFRSDPMRNGFTPERTTVLYGDLLGRLSGVHGVRAVALMNNPLIGGGGSSTVAALPNAPALEPGTPEARAFFDSHRTFLFSVSEEFFKTVGLPVLQGRGIEARDTATAQSVAVVNEALALQLFGTTDVIGRRFKTDLRANGTIFEIVGVCGNARIASVRRAVQPAAYFSFQQRPVVAPVFALKTIGDPLAIASAVRDVVRQVDPNLPLFALRTQQGQIDQSLASERLLARLATMLGIVTLLLSGTGLFGLLAYDVTRRTPEIGLRMALGAPAGTVRWMVMRQAMIVIASGLLVGIPAAVAGARIVGSLLFGLTPRDPVSFAIAAAVMMAVGTAAAFFPARRAAQVDPIVALRTE